MAMGSNQKVVIDNEMQNAKKECQSFRAEVDNLVKDLDSTVNTLMNGFKGEAADGFQEFYSKNITAFFAKGGSFDQFIGMFDKDGEGLFDTIEKTLIGGEGLDPSLGNNNRNVGQSSGEQ